MLKQILSGFLAVVACLSAAHQTAKPKPLPIRGPLPAPAQARDGDQFLIGVLGADGVIVPFAQYRKGKWLNPWPKPKSYPEEPDNDEPNTLTDQPKPWFEQYLKRSSKWYLASQKESAEVIKTLKVLKIDSHCTPVWGLATEYPPRPDANMNQKKRGVVVSADRKFFPMVEPGSTSPDRSRVSAFISSDFPRAESVGISRMAEYGMVLDLPGVEARNKVPLSGLTLYSAHAGIDGRPFYYFEARKEYPKPPFSNDQGCNNISIFSGWLVQDQQGRLNLIDSEAYVTDCDQKEGGMTNPFGTLVVDGRTFVIVEELGYESESYVILELDDAGIHRVLETYAGAC